MTNLDVTYIWEQFPLAIGLQYHQLYWKERNEQRKLSAFGKVPEILVLQADLGDGSAADDPCVVPYD